jgi:alanine racemase
VSPAPVSRLIIDLDAYAHNLGVVRSLIPEDCGIMAVVKADAYGLGAIPVARKAVECGVAMLGVATVREGIELREAGIEDIPILVLITSPEDALGPALNHKLRLTVADVATAERLGDIARKTKKVAAIHCEIDTGMGRQGFTPENALNELLGITRISNVDIEGIFTHFPSANVVNDPFTLNQIKTMRQFLRQVDKSGVPYEMSHAANSAAIVNYPGAAFDLVRAGLMAYGVWPGETPPPAPKLRPVVQWNSRIILIKNVAGGASIGYGRTYKAPRPIKTAVVPVGYAHGYPCQLSNKGLVLIRGQRCAVLGAVSMEQIIVDVSALKNPEVGEPVTLLGGQGENAITVEEMAKTAELIPHAILTGVHPRVERQYQDA